MPPWRIIIAVPGPQGRPVSRLVASFAVAVSSYAAATLLGAPAWAEPVDTNEITPCWSEQIAVTANPSQAAAGHRAVTLTFVLAGGAEPCTLTGYPAVDSGAGGPAVHARSTPRGYMGGLPTDLNAPPTVTLSISQQGQAIVEGVAFDGGTCPTYTDLGVSPPGIIQVFTVAATIDACALEVHPVTVG